MRPEWIYPLSSPDSLTPQAIEAAHAVLRSGHYTMGEAVAAFERDFADWVGTTHAVMVNSGSSANLLAVDALMRPTRHHWPTWGRGCEVLVPAVSWSTTVWPLIQLGLMPVWVDVDPETLALDWAHADSLITSRTVGAMLVHVMGLAADLDDAHDFCERHHLTLIEDCCEAFGAHWHRSHVGTFGTMGTFSFYFSHQLPAIEGGMIVTSDDTIADDLRSLRSHGWSRHRVDHADWEKGTLDPRFLFVGSGYNVRPLELQGAIARVQLHEADASLESREMAVSALVQVLQQVPWIRVVGREFHAIHRDRRSRRHSWMNLPCLLTADAPMTAVELRTHLELAGLETRPFLAGNLMRQPAFKAHGKHAECPVADQVMRDGFLMGCHPFGDLSKAIDVLERLAKVAA